MHSPFSPAATITLGRMVNEFAANIACHHADGPRLQTTDGVNYDGKAVRYFTLLCGHGCCFSLGSIEHDSGRICGEDDQ